MSRGFAGSAEIIRKIAISGIPGTVKPTFRNPRSSIGGEAKAPRLRLLDALYIVSRLARAIECVFTEPTYRMVFALAV